MNLPDRQTAPPAFPLPIPRIQRPESAILKNGVEWAFFRNPSQNLVSLELVFPATSLETHTRETDGYVYKLLTEGTKAKTAKQVADAISLLGASLDISHHPDYDLISVSCLSRFFPRVLDLLEEFWTESVYPEKEWKTIRETQIRQHQISLKKTSFLSSRLFRSLLFREGNAYGYSFSPEWVEALAIDTIRSRYEDVKKNGPALALVAGAISPEDESRLIQWLESFPVVRGLKDREILLAQAPVPGTFWAPLDEAKQASLRIGQFTIGPKHPDSALLSLVLEIYGGYFGSRLMSNIREDKGWTYGIFAQRVAMQDQSYWVVGSDIKGEVLEEALVEIRKEADILHQERVSEEELETVKNYMRGQFLSGITHCFNQAERFRSAWLAGLQLEDLERKEKEIEAAGPEVVRDMAQKYLNPEEAVFALSGRKPS